MSKYYPDNWVVIKTPYCYKVLAGWSGGYHDGSSWRMNSGIVDVSANDHSYTFIGSSGSSYVCHKETYGLRMNNAYVWNGLKKKYENLIELMPEDTDWEKVNWGVTG